MRRVNCSKMEGLVMDLNKTVRTLDSTHSEDFGFYSRAASEAFGVMICTPNLV